MKTKFNFLPFVLLTCFFAVCFSAGCVRPHESLNGAKVIPPTQGQVSQAGRMADIDITSLLRTLDELAELERAGSWIQGMALTESGIRESLGDYPGAVAAAYKELSWAYGLGLIQKEEVEQGLLNVLAANSDEIVAASVNAILAFLRGQWNEATNGLDLLFSYLESDEPVTSAERAVTWLHASEGSPPDGFGRWMLLSSALELSIWETENEERRTGAAYRSIRARYAQFPEYWYRGARAFTGIIAADFAENCINLSPTGPFADECRIILADYAGIRMEDGLSIRTRREIDMIISQAVNSGKPQFLEQLFPLISLNDNPYTTYAVGALRSLAGVPRFRDYFSTQAAAARGRLAERLIYISRG